MVPTFCRRPAPSQPATSVLLIAAFTVFLAAVPRAFGQDDPQRRARQSEETLLEEIDARDIELPLDERLEEPLQDIEFDWGGWARASYYHFRDNLQYRGYRIYDLRLWANFVYKDTHQIYFRPYGLITDFNNGDEYSFLEENDLDAPRLDIGYYYGDIGKALDLGFDGDLRIKGGRQYVTVGEGLVLDVRGDGALGEVHTDAFELNLFGVRHVVSENYFDRSYPDYGHTRNLYGGAELIGKVTDQLDVYTYAMMLRDKKDEERPLAPGQKFQYDAEYYGAGLRGQVTPAFQYFGEYVRQTGERYSEGGLEKDDIQAYAYDMGVSYAFLDTELEPTVSLQYVVGSGDKDTGVPQDTIGGNLAGTDDHNFFAYGYVDTGFAFFPLISNVRIFKVGCDFLPINDHEALGDVEAGAAWFYYRKHTRQGGVSDRGVDVNSNESRLGHEADVYVTWRPLSDVSVMLQYGLFFPNKDAFTEGAETPRSYFSAGLILYF